MVGRVKATAIGVYHPGKDNGRREVDMHRKGPSVLRKASVEG
jgi:hypothetical protein